MSRIALSGAIAVGKSTLATGLAAADPRVSIHVEDVAELSFLERFYAEPSRWAFHSRIEFLAVKGAELRGSRSGGAGAVTLMDRVLPELVTFARVMRASGLLSAEEYEVYFRVWRLLTESLPAFDGYIWVRCDPQKSLERIATRGRKFEAGIGLEYLEALHAEYARWSEEISEAAPLLVVDTTQGAGATEMALDWMRSHGFIV